MGLVAFIYFGVLWPDNRHSLGNSDRSGSQIEKTRFEFLACVLRYYLGNRTIVCIRNIHAVRNDVVLINTPAPE